MQTTPTEDQKQRYLDAVAALNACDWQRSQTLAMHLLREIPPHAGVYFVAGVAAMQLQQLPLAQACLERAAQLNPTRPDYKAQYARSLAVMSRTDEAKRIADSAMQLSPADPMTLDTLGIVYTQANFHSEAAALFRRAVELEPAQASYHFNLATSLVFAGEIEQAEQELETCLALAPRYWKAYLTLSQQRRQTPGSNHLARLGEALAGSADDPEAATYLNLAMAKEYEDLGDYPRAFEATVRGKEAAGAKRKYSFARDEAVFDAIEDQFPGAADVSAGLDADEPIFVFGMPRTGTTLVERIVSSHRAVESAGELQEFGIALKRLSGSRTPELLDVDTFAAARRLDWKQLGETYLASTRYRTGRSAHFIDKLPHNFLFAGHIANALPGAKLICVRRNPVDTCLSNFRQLFAQNSSYYDYSFDLLDTARYYARFDRLVAFWQRLFPGRILEVGYEDLVETQEAATRRLLDFCELPWDDACLRFEDNAAPVATASAVQVRAPIYRSALRRWRNYEPQVGHLLDFFDEAGIPYGGRA